jgi:hypothetical protein
MRILIDIGHPGHVHLFKNFAKEMHKKGHSILFTCRQKEFERELLQAENFDFKSFGKHYNTKTGKIWGLIKFNFVMLLTALQFKPNLFLSHGSIYAAQVAWLMGKPHIAMEDTGNHEQVKLYLPFTKYVLTSNIFPINYGKKQIRYNSHHELAYLHPKYFNKDISFKKRIGYNSKDKYVLLRFVSWKASHDKGQSGLTESMKEKLITLISKKYKIVISSESKFPDKYNQYRATFHPTEIHHVLNHAEFFIGEGTTMAMEAAILGTPSIYINSLQYSNVKDLEQYGLLYNYKNESYLLSKVKEFISSDDMKINYIEKRKQLLNDKIDLTAFLIWFIENYPESAKIMKENPDYQYRFK